MPGEWMEYKEGPKEKFYRCPECKRWSGRMYRRDIYEPSGDSHREFRIVCRECEHKSGVHWSKALTELTWEAAGGASF